MKTSSITSFLCLGNRGLASVGVVTLAKGGGQLALGDASSDVIRYLGGGVHCLNTGSRGGSSLETVSAELYGTVDEDRTFFS